VGGGAMPAPTPIPLPMQAMAGNVAFALPAGAMPAPAPVMSATLLRQPAPQMVAVADVMSETAPMMEAQTASPPLHAPIAAPLQSVPDTGGAPPPARPPLTASRAGLFAEPSRSVPVAAQQPAEPARPSLFSTVTGAFRRRNQPAAPVAEPAQMRSEPVAQEHHAEPPRASVRQTAGDEVAGLDIPAFLRRQSS